jgi:energy-coupling factor transporter ATP-binding protein EcfA2
VFRSRPLYATTADSRYMVWTADARAARAALGRGRNTLVHGPSGAGRTTLLHQIEHELRAAGGSVLFVALRDVADALEASELLLDAAAEAGLVAGDGAGEPRPRAGAESPLAVNRAVRRLGSLPAGTVLLVDDVGAAVGHALFGRLRDDLWQLPLTWGVAVHDDDVGGLLTPPADAFFETTVALRPLDARERVELVEKRATSGRGDLSRAQIESLGDSGPGNPRRLVDLGRLAAEDDVDPQQLIAAARRRLQLAESAAGRDGAMLVVEMQSLGPVSASDETLAGRLGWPRPRIASTLSRLEGAALARSFLEAREGRTGRPRKLYELVPETELMSR